MGPKLFAVFMIAFLVLTFSAFSMAGIQITNDGEVLMALDLAALAGATKWDEEATAEAGVIMLDTVAAEDEVRHYFSYNTNHLKIDSSQLEVEVVNNAPISRFVGGDTLFFASNGIIVSYGNFHQAVEVDDLLFEEIDDDEEEEEEVLPEEQEP